jgi:hypothetical protein
MVEDVVVLPNLPAGLARNELLRHCQSLGLKVRRP